VTPWVTTTLLSSTIRRFIAMRPDVSLSLHETVGTSYTSLREGSIDLAIGLAPPEDTASDLIGRPLFSYSQAIVCRSGHPCRNVRTLDALTTQSWILSHEIDQYQSPLRDFFLAAYPPEKAGGAAGRIHYTRSALMGLQIVEDSDILTIVPWPLIEAMRERHGIEALTLREPMPENTTSYLTRRNTPTNGCIGDFVDALMATVKEASVVEKGLLQRLFRSVDIIRHK
jgi:LysR family transcriptional regulator of abg operon